MFTNQLSDFKNAFFIGIGGISMSGLAEVLASEKIRVSGSDQSASSVTEHLNQFGITTYIGHDEKHIDTSIDLVVYTAAVKSDNPELVKSRKLGIRIMERAELLGLIMSCYQHSIAVSGTHGKTTTTSMLSNVMLAADLDPTISVGGILNAIQSNFRLGSSEYFITEACEYNNSYHHFFPTIAIILNIEHDHPDFFPTLDDVFISFRKFIETIPKNGCCILNDSIDRISYLTEGMDIDFITVGQKPDSNYSFSDLTFNDQGYASYTLQIDGVPSQKITLAATGLHNVTNSLAVIATAMRLGVPLETIANSLAGFSGVKRRFEYKGSFQGIRVFDDYAHHPTEILATIEAAKKLSYHRMWIVFQPHTYSRTKSLYPEFVEALSHGEKIIITDIYSARELDLGEIHSKSFVDSLGKLGKDIVYIADFDEIEKYLLQECVPNDLLITMGAGNIHIIGEQLISR